jgi:hypothetical protein
LAAVKAAQAGVRIAGLMEGLTVAAAAVVGVID